MTCMHAVAMLDGIHVDDQAIMGPCKQVIAKFKAELASEFKMKDLGALTHILGVEVKRDCRNRVLTLHQDHMYGKCWKGTACKIATLPNFLLRLV